MSLKEARIAKGLTQKQLSEATNISLRTLQDYEQKHKDIAGCKYSRLKKIAEVLEVSIDELIKD